MTQHQSRHRVREVARAQTGVPKAQARGGSACVAPDITDACTAEPLVLPQPDAVADEPTQISTSRPTLRIGRRDFPKLVTSTKPPSLIARRRAGHPKVTARTAPGVGSNPGYSHPTWLGSVPKARFCDAASLVPRYGYRPCEVPPTRATSHIDTRVQRDMRRATGAPLRLCGLNAVRQLSVVQRARPVMKVSAIPSRYRSGLS